MDDFETHMVTLTSPAVGGTLVTPDDANDLPFLTRAIYVGGTGSVAAVLQSGDTVLLSGAQEGTIYPVRVARILATGTTATNIVGLR